MFFRFFFNYVIELTNKLIKNNHRQKKNSRYIRSSLFF